MKEMLGGCCVCADENGWTDNPLIYCDGPNCEVAVHQGCYGIQEVPEGEWYCAKCNASPSTSSGPYTNAGVSKEPSKLNGHRSFRCELCPSSYGALKRTEKNGWAHVICALYIPEVRFGDVHSMEPVILSDVPTDRFEKPCYICDSAGRRQDAKLGACMSCNKPGCKRGFHVTCAQLKGLLCEEGGGSKNVKYCGYCENHLRKAQHDPSIKVIPACPIARFAQHQSSSSENNESTPPTPPPSSNNSTASHMLVDPLLPRTDQNNTLRYSSPIASSTAVSSSISSTLPTKSEELPTSSSSSSNNHMFASTTAFSPPLTSSSRSSVALDATPPLAAVSSHATLLTNGSASTSLASHLMPINAETTVGSHLQHLQQQQQQQAAAAAAVQAAMTSSAVTSVAESLNGLYSSSNVANAYSQLISQHLQNEQLTNHNRLPASLLQTAEFHLNGSVSDLEEKTVKAVLTAPLVAASAKGKRMRDKPDLIEKVKRPRANHRSAAAAAAAAAVHAQSPAAAVAAAVNAQVGKQAVSMQRLISLVAPVVSETVSDFQRDRIADRTAAERRAAAAMSAPSTSTNVSASEIAANVVGNATVAQGGVIPTHSVPIANMNGQVNGGTRNHSTLPSSMEQLLERQWEQGSQFLMSQAHFDVAQLLTCLHQLKSENIRLEDQLQLLGKRREHLSALNQRLSQPLGPPLPSRQGNDQNSHASSSSGQSQITAPLPIVGGQPSHPSPHVASSTVQMQHQQPHHMTAQATEDTLSQLRSLAASSMAGAVPISRPTPHLGVSSAAAALQAAGSSATNSTYSNAAAAQQQHNAVASHRATPSTAGQSMAATPIMSAATSSTQQLPSTVTQQHQIATPQPLSSDFTNMSPDRLAQQLNVPFLNQYRNQLLDPNMLTQILVSQSYMNNQAASAAMLQRIMSQQLPSLSSGTPQPGATATSNGK